MEYEKTIHGLHRKRRELIVEAEQLRERIAILQNQRVACESALEAFGVTDLGRDKHVNHHQFKRGHLRRFITDYMRENERVTTNQLTEALMLSRGEDPADRLYRGEIRRAVTHALYNMGKAGSAVQLEQRNGRRGYVWGLARGIAYEK